MSDIIKPMKSQTLICSKHNDNQVTFVCLGNCWHFQPLCSTCIPEHTQNHSKKIKIHLESLQKVMEKSQEQRVKALQLYEGRLGKCKQLKSSLAENRLFIQEINEKRVNIINSINQYFDELILQTKTSQAKQESAHLQSLDKVIGNIEQHINSMSKQHYENITDFKDSVKGFYFKEDLQVYVEQIDELIKDYEEKVIKYNPYRWESIEDSAKKSKLFISSLFKDLSIKQIEEPKAKPDVKKIEKKPTIKVNKKKCNNCGQEMEYLTEWKKHLICRNCGGKQRNYVKK